MGRFAVKGGVELRGTVRIGGAKNAVLPILAASVVASDTVTLRNVPNISDVQVLCNVLREIGLEVIRDGSTITVIPQVVVDTTVSESASKVRFSIILLGAILAKMGEVCIPLPGGDALGSRRIDQHMLALEKLGAEVAIDKTLIRAKARVLEGRSHTMTFPSVSGTENAVLMACAAKGTSTLSNIALEPEVQSFMHFLCTLGARIEGIGSDSVQIQGRADWGGAQVAIMPDRLEAMTYAMFVGATGGEIIIHEFDSKTLGAEWDVLARIGLILEKCSKGIQVCRDKSFCLCPLDVEVGRYPLFHTDLQPMLVALLGVANGESRVVEGLYGSDRFQYVPQLQKMGAQIKIHGDTVLVSGICRYGNAKVRATDIRGGAAVVLAALSAEGESHIQAIHHIDRGYEDFEQKLQRLGAGITRVGDHQPG